MDYPNSLYFTSDPSWVFNQLIEDFDPDKVIFLVDENTGKYCLHAFSNPEHITITSGEAHKTLDTCQYLWQELTEREFSRKSMLVNLGGGVIGDMGGFVAATYKRGIRFVNMPTTLLSMVDASIGGKLGVDFKGLKNHIGVFQEPDAIVISPNFLKTLPERQIKSGFAEILKHGLIWDRNYWEKIRNTYIQSADWNPIIKKSVTIKHAVVTADPQERGLRKILNFGHSLGHAIETHFLETPNPLLHGEAIAIGMLLESFLANLKGLLSLEDLDEITRVMKHYYELPKLPDPEDILQWLVQDKKNEGSKLNFSLIEQIGKCNFDVEVNTEEIKESLAFYQEIR